MFEPAILKEPHGQRVCCLYTALAAAIGSQSRFVRGEFVEQLYWSITEYVLVLCGRSSASLIWSSESSHFPMAALLELWGARG